MPRFGSNASFSKDDSNNHKNKVTVDGQEHGATLKSALGSFWDQLNHPIKMVGRPGRSTPKGNRYQRHLTYSDVGLVLHGGKASIGL